MQAGRIYLDHAATTPLLPAARDAMAVALARWANPSSPHAEGRAARAELESRRERIAQALGWNGEIIFTSGATEALAIALSRVPAGPRFVSAVEHDAVFRAAPNARKLAIDRDGTADLSEVAGKDPLVAIQHVNNETGVIQPLERIGAQVRALRGLLLADCAQSAGKLPLPDADMIVISAHKLGGPPGVGALLLRDFSLIEAIGGQEQGYRPGTENLPGIIGMSVALEADRQWLEDIGPLRDRLDRSIVAAGGEAVAVTSERLPVIGAYRMPGVSSEVQLIRFDMAGISVSAGSACSSGSLKRSHVLMAMGLDEIAAGETVRVSFGRSTTQAEADRFADVWCDLAAKAKAA